jgi:hypothetical protein
VRVRDSPAPKQTCRVARSRPPALGWNRDCCGWDSGSVQIEAAVGRGQSGFVLFGLLFFSLASGAVVTEETRTM